MHDHPDVTMLVPAVGPVDLVIDWHPHASPIPPHATTYIAQRWSHYLAQAQAHGHSLFDGTITQLLAIQLDRRPTPARLTLTLAPATYKDFLVTRLRDRDWFETHAPDCRIGALGNSALVTHGPRALLGRRSAQVSSYAGRLHLIGGVLEALGTPAYPATPEGIQAHLLLELREEIGLAPGEERRDGWPRMLGLAQDEFLGQPELFWQWEVQAELESLQSRMNPAEHSQALILGHDDMTDSLWQELTPVARIAWEIWTGQAHRSRK